MCPAHPIRALYPGILSGHPHHRDPPTHQVAGGYDHNYVLFNLSPGAKQLVMPNGMASSM